MDFSKDYFIKSSYSVIHFSQKCFQNSSQISSSNTSTQFSVLKGFFWNLLCDFSKEIIFRGIFRYINAKVFLVILVFLQRFYHRYLQTFRQVLFQDVYQGVLQVFLRRLVAVIHYSFYTFLGVIVQILLLEFHRLWLEIIEDFFQDIYMKVFFPDFWVLFFRDMFLIFLRSMKIMTYILQGFLTSSFIKNSFEIFCRNNSFMKFFQGYCTVFCYC